MFSRAAPRKVRPAMPPQSPMIPPQGQIMPPQSPMMPRPNVAPNYAPNYMVNVNPNFNPNFRSGFHPIYSDQHYNTGVDYHSPPGYDYARLQYNPYYARNYDDMIRVYATNYSQPPYSHHDPLQKVPVNQPPAAPLAITLPKNFQSEPALLSSTSKTQFSEDIVEQDEPTRKLEPDINLRPSKSILKTALKKDPAEEKQYADEHKNDQYDRKPSDSPTPYAKPSYSKAKFGTLTDIKPDYEKPVFHPLIRPSKSILKQGSSYSDKKISSYETPASVSTVSGWKLYTSESSSSSKAGSRTSVCLPSDDRSRKTSMKNETSKSKKTAEDKKSPVTKHKMKVKKIRKKAP